MSNIEHELQTNAANIKRLRNQMAIDSHQVDQHEHEAAAYKRRWLNDYGALNRAKAAQQDQLFKLLTCGLSHRRVMHILRRLGC